MPELTSLIGSSYTSQSPLADCERTVNLYEEQMESQGAKTRSALYPTPGFSATTTVSDVGGRAFATMNGRTLAVMGGQIYTLPNAFSATALGAIAQDSNLAQIAFNGKVGGQALICSGGQLKVVTLATNAVTNPSTFSGTATMVGMLDGYGVVFDGTASRIYLSNLNDFSVMDPTQFAARNDAPDNWRAMVVNAPNIWLIGERTGCVWYDLGSFPFPFAPRPGINFKVGIRAPFTLQAAGDTVLWLAQTTEGEGRVVRTQGFSPVRCSTYAVEKAIDEYTQTSTIDDAEALVYQDLGHTWYVLNFPSARASWAMDIETGKWHERGRWDPTQTSYDVWSPRVHTVAYGKHLVADRRTGIIAEMDPTFGSEVDGSAIRRLRRHPGAFNEMRQTRIGNLEMYLERGLGTSTGQGSDPLVMFRASQDGGKTWSYERQIRAGKMGEYQRRVRAWKLGAPRDPAYEWVMSDPIPWRIIKGFYNNVGRRGGAA